MRESKVKVLKVLKEKTWLLQVAAFCGCAMFHLREAGAVWAALPPLSQSAARVVEAQTETRSRPQISLSTGLQQLDVKGSGVTSGDGQQVKDSNMCQRLSEWRCYLHRLTVDSEVCLRAAAHKQTETTAFNFVRADETRVLLSDALSF